MKRKTKQQNFQPTEVTSSFHWGENMQLVLSGRPLLLCTAVAMLRAYTLTSVVTTTQAEVDYQLSTTSVIHPIIALRSAVYLIR